MTTEEDDVIVEVESQLDWANNGDSGGSWTPPSCTWTDENGEQQQGRYRWALTVASQDAHHEGHGTDAEEGTYYAYECWDDAMETDKGPGHSCFTDEDGVDRCFGDLVSDVDTFCGSSVCLFDAITPENLALLALDRAIRTLQPPEARFNPPNETTIVNFDTWMWVENVPEDREQSFPAVEVLDEWIQATATFEEVVWDMGDGNVFSCPLTTDEVSAQQHDCSTYRYQQSSAGQGSDDKFEGSVSIQWEISYWGVLNGSDVPETTFTELRESPFSLEVLEGQAIVADR